MTLRSATAAVLLLTAGCDAPCGNTRLRELAAPDGARKVVVFIRDCGATTDYSTNVSVVSAATSLPSGAGNAVRLDSNRGVAPVAADHSLPLRLTWVDASHLDVRYDRRARVYLAERQKAGVFISYDATRVVEP